MRQAVQEGRYAPGQRLIEADLRREYGVSRGPVREALRRLATEGVVDFVPNRGALAKRFTSREMASRDAELEAIRPRIEPADG